MPSINPLYGSLDQFSARCGVLYSSAAAAFLADLSTLPLSPPIKLYALDWGRERRRRTGGNGVS